MAEEQKKEEVKKPPTKKDKEEAINKFLGFEAPFSKWTDDQMDDFITNIMDTDKMCIRFFEGSNKKIPLFRRITMIRLSQGFQERMGQVQTLLDILDSDTPVLDFVSQMQGRMGGGGGDSNK